jgi:hypothetical protein
MSQQSVSLDELASSEPAATATADEERVKRIMASINASESVQAPPAQLSSPQVITEPPLSVSTGQIRMDPGTARAHVIGNSAPSMADFQAMFQQMSPGMAPFHGPAATPAGPVVPAPSKSSSDWRGMLVAYTRGPLAVAIIVFLLNMPIVTSVLSRYASWMYLSSGEISVGGLLVKALLAAGLFAVYQAASTLFDGSK